MKTALRSFAALAVVFACAGAAPGAETPAAAPASTTPASSAKLVAAEPVRDVGKVMKGEKISVVFELRNEGTDELVLTDVRPTCGCTVANYDAKIAPGKTGKVHAEVDTAEFSGPISKTITVLSNDAANPRLTLTIKAVVEQAVRLQPGFARFNYVQTQAPVTAQQWIWTEDFADFRVTAVDSPYKFILATFREAKPEERRSEVTSGARQWLVETTIQPDAEVGALRDFLVVTTNHPKQKEIKIPLSGFVRPILSVTPYVADFGSVTMTPEGKDLSIIVTNFGKEPVEITRVTTGVAGVEATVKAIEAGKRFEIRLALTPAMAKGSVSSTLKIETSSPAKPTLDVPFKGTVS
jgi:hypothetical protein